MAAKTFLRGECDCCGKPNRFLAFCVAYGIDTYACQSGCDDPQDDPDEYIDESTALEDCPTCGGGGFAGYGTGYDDVCGNCGGLKQLPKGTTK